MHHLADKDSDDNSGYSGREKSGHAAAVKAPSAAGIAAMLKGLSFPADKNQIVKNAEAHKNDVRDSQQVLEAVRALPEKQYISVAGVEKSFGQER